MDKKRLCVLASGVGTNLQSIIDATKSKYISAEVSCIISDNPSAFAIKRAMAENIPVFCILYKNREKAEQIISEIIEYFKIDLIALAGFMRILSQKFVERYKFRIVNIHPAILPSFKGVNAQKMAVEYAVRFSGCTVHFVDAGVDTGPIIVQSVVPCYPQDDEKSLRERILKMEHKIYPFAIKLILEGKVKVSGRNVYLEEVEWETSCFVNPKIN